MGATLGAHQRASFSALFEEVRPGGLYVIEDFATAYWPDWEGGPPGTPGTAIKLAKNLIDDIRVGPRAIASVNAIRESCFSNVLLGLPGFEPADPRHCRQFRGCGRQWRDLAGFCS